MKKIPTRPSIFSFCITYLASTFSDIKDLVFPKGNRHTGHVTSFGWHSWHTTWPLSHWKTGADLGTFRHTGHSRTSLRSSAEIMGCLAAITLKENDENMTEFNWIWNIYLIEWAHYLWRISLLCTFKPLIVLTIWNDFSQKKFWKNFHWREMTAFDFFENGSGNKALMWTDLKKKYHL